MSSVPSSSLCQQVPAENPSSTPSVSLRQQVPAENPSSTPSVPLSSSPSRAEFSAAPPSASASPQTTASGALGAPSRVLSPKPPWLRVRAPGGERYHELKDMLRELSLHTVCEEANCPNVGECWREGTATVMLLGSVCTRGCRFCAVDAGHPGPVDPAEPDHVAEAIARMSLAYVVLTMVDRDDLPDGGAEHVARTIRRLRALRADLLVEALVGDFQGDERAIDRVAEAAPDVFAHNVEVVRRITPKIRDARCRYDRSLDVLRRAKRQGSVRVTKSSVMVGVGETDDEVLETMGDLRSADVDIVTIGQYLRPSAWHAPVERYVAPERFAWYAEQGTHLGFKYVASGPLVRSSYRAAEVFVRSVLHPKEGVDSALAQRLEDARAATRSPRGDLIALRRKPV